MHVFIQHCDSYLVFNSRIYYSLHRAIISWVNCNYFYVSCLT